MKISNGLFIVCIGSFIIMLSPIYGKDGAANMPMMFTGLAIAVIGGIFVYRKIKKGKNDQDQGDDKK
ncbi:MULTISPECIES: DUF3188 domain-containing protein [Listeria]|uniref:DUF3188 domain-containing protein n=1 Tax=Listeria TaxID=1637 RepID=UPI000C06DAEB|nr:MULTISPECIES: DUF3188 domain-containing protein [Listeria]